MRGFPGVVAGIEKALPIFHKAGIYPAVNLGINRNIGGETTSRLKREDFDSDASYLEIFYFRYLDASKRFYQRAVDLGFTIANTCYPMSAGDREDGSSLNAIYRRHYHKQHRPIQLRRKTDAIQRLISAIPRFRSKLRIFSRLCSLEALIRQYRNDLSGRQPYGCRGGVDFFYVNASDGHTYPCGYRGTEDLGKFGELDMRRFRPETDNKACHRCDSGVFPGIHPSCSVRSSTFSKTRSDFFAMH